MADELDKLSSNLSSEDIKRLADTISKANDLIAHQEEMIEKVIEGEKRIGETRIAYLKQYYETYSEYLNKIAAKRSGELKDTFANLERQALNNFTAAVSKGGSNRSGNDQEQTQQRTPKKTDNSQNNAYVGDQNNEHPNSVTESARKQMGDAFEREDNRMLEPGQAEQIANELARLFKKAETGVVDLNKLVSNSIIDQTKLNDLRKAREEEHLEKQFEFTQKILSAEERVASLRSESSGEFLNMFTDLGMQKQAEASEAAATAEVLMSSIKAELKYNSGDGKDQEETVNEAIATRLKTIQDKEKAKSAQELKDRMEKDRARMEAGAIAKHGTSGEALDAALREINKTIAERYQNVEEQVQQITEKRLKEEAKEREKAEKDEKKKRLVAGEEALNTLTGKGSTVTERAKALKNLIADKDSGELNGKSVGKGLLVATKMISNLAQQLEGKIDSIASFKGTIDTRLQGSSQEQYKGSYWDQLVKDMTSVGAVNPFFKQEDFANNMKSLVERGIAFDLEQRAFLLTIKDKIASTFDVADASLLRLVRIQQEDSTAGRLGMESALNSFLNEMYETSEYLSDVASSVRRSLEEMESLMSGAEATEVEYQVQKWLGSLYSVGMSQEAVQSISDTLGKIASGQIEGLTGDGASNLLIMAANDAGIPIADILSRGITADETNQLLRAAVNYLAELAEASGDNRVVQQQLANVFGVKASDLRAATNIVLPGTTSNIYKNYMTYNNMLEQLSTMAGTMHNRTSIAEMMTNFWENGQYSLAGSMESDPVSYLIYKMATVLDNTAGGIPLPFLNVMGFGVDLETKVSDLMRVAAMSKGIFSSLGPMISGLGNSFDGRKMLAELGIKSDSGLEITPRGTGDNFRNSSSGGGQKSTSGSGYVGNSSGSDIKDSTIQEADNSKKQQMIEAKEEAEANQVDLLNTTVLKIYELLNDVANGSSYFRVKIDNYGLTKAGNSSGTLGGVGALEGLSSGSFGSSSNLNSNSGSGSTSGPSSGSSGDTIKSLDFGGWTTTV